MHINGDTSKPHYIITYETQMTDSSTPDHWDTMPSKIKVWPQAGEDASIAFTRIFRSCFGFTLNMRIVSIEHIIPN